MSCGWNNMDERKIGESVSVRQSLIPVFCKDTGELSEAVKSIAMKSSVLPLCATPSLLFLVVDCL